MIFLLEERLFHPSWFQKTLFKIIYFTLIYIFDKLHYLIRIHSIIKYGFIIWQYHFYIVNTNIFFNFQNAIRRCSLDSLYMIPHFRKLNPTLVILKKHNPCIFKNPLWNWSFNWPHLVWHFLKAAFLLMSHEKA